MSNARFNLSAANVMIELPMGRPVGNMQNITLNISHNQQQIKNLHNTHIQGFVKGFTINSASASRAVIDYETFFGDHRALTEYYLSAENISKALFDQIKTSDVFNEATVEINGKQYSEIKIPGTNTKIPIRNILGGIGNFLVSNGNAIDIRETVELFEKLAKGEISIADLFGHVEFNLVARGNMELWRLEGCVLQSRNIRIDTGELIIMENIEILAKRFIDVNLNSEISGGKFERFNI